MTSDLISPIGILISIAFMVFYGISVLNPDGNSARSHSKYFYLRKLIFGFMGRVSLK